MNRKAIVSLVLVVLFLVSVFPISTFSGVAASRGSSGVPESQLTVAETGNANDLVPDQTKGEAMAAHQATPVPRTSGAASPLGVGYTQPSGLVGYWNFDEGGGSTAYDSSGNNNNGIVYGASWTGGKVGNALSFDGVNDYVDCGAGSSLMPTAGITLEAWFNANDVSTPGTIVSTYYYNGYFLRINRYAGVEFAPGICYSLIGIIQSGVWYHVVGTFNGTLAQIYVNGTLVGSQGSGYLAYTGQPLRIGNNPGDNTLWFNGIIDEVKIYSRALSAEEILAEYAAQVVDWWPMFHHDLTHAGYSTSTAPTTNNVLWTFNTGSPIEYSSPTIVDDLLYVGSWAGGVYCLNASTGVFVWSFPAAGRVGSCPAVVGGLLYVGSWNGKVYCLNASTGAPVWSFQTGDSVESSPAVYGGRVYVGSNDNHVYCLNAASGVFLWKYLTLSWVASCPAVVGGVVFVGSGDTYVYALGALNGNFIWKRQTINPVVSSPAVAGGRVYVGSGSIYWPSTWAGGVYCLAASSGAVIWKFLTPNPVESSPAVFNGMVFVGSEGTGINAKNGFVYALSAATGALVWSFTTGAAVEVSSPAVANNMVFVGSNDTNVYALAASTGTVVWTYTTGAVVESSPAVVNNTVYVGSDNGNVYAFGVSGASAGPYCELLGLTFTQNFNSMSFNVTAVAQPYDATGPAYFLCGLSNMGFMYEVGLSYEWLGPGTGFAASYAVFGPGGTPVFPTGGGLALVSLSVTPGGSVQLALTFSGGSVLMYVHDWNTGASASNAYNSYGATYFVGLPNSFANPSSLFTGLMTEQWHTNPYYGGMLPVVYSDMTLAKSSAWMWMQLINSVGTYLFTVSTSGPVSFANDPLPLQQFAAYGATEYSNAYQFVTGGPLTSTGYVLAISPGSVTMNVGQSQTFTASVVAPGGSPPYIYQWYLDGAVVPGATSSSWTFKPALPGSYTIRAAVIDSLADSASAAVTATVNGQLSVSVSPSSVMMNVGQSQLFTASVSGGTPPYFYRWYLNGIQFPGATSNSWTFTPSSAGSYTVYVRVADSVGGQATSNTATVTVALAVDWWPMFHHDLNRTGYSTSTAPNTNQTLWKYATGPYWVESSAAVFNGVVYVGSWDGSIYALNATTGALIWKFTAGSPMCYSSPAVAGNLVYVGSGGKVYALNATTGALVWSHQTGGAVFSSPAVEGGVVYVGSQDNKTYALNATTGALIWSFTTGGFVDSSPAVVYGVVYVGSLDHNVYALNATTGALIWSFTTGGGVFSSPAVFGGVVYVGSWDGSIYALNATTGTQIWTFAPGYWWVWSSPAVAGGVVYVGSQDGNVYALNAATGTSLWNYTTGGGVVPSPAVVGGVVYVGSQDGNVYAFGQPFGQPLCAMKTQGDGWFYVPTYSARPTRLRIEMLGGPTGDQFGGVSPYTAVTAWPSGKTNILDIVFVAYAFGSTPGSPSWNYMADVVPDQIINILDIFLVARSFGVIGTYLMWPVSNVTVQFSDGTTQSPDTTGFVTIPITASYFTIYLNGSPVGATVTFWP